MLEASGRNGDRLLSEVSVTFSQGRLEIIEPKDKRNLLRGHAGLDVTVEAPAGSSLHGAHGLGRRLLRGPTWPSWRPGRPAAT